MPAASPASWALLARALVEANRLLPPAQRQWSEVEKAANQAAADPAQAVLVALVRADVEAITGHPDKARAGLEAAAKEHPNDPVLYLALADLASRRGDVAAIAAALKKGDNALHDRLDWLRLRVDRLAGRGDDLMPNELAKLESRAATLPTSRRDPLERHLVAAHLRLGNHSDVECLCVNLLAYRGNDAQVRLWLTESLLARGDIKEAQRQIDDLRAFEGEAGLGWRCARAELLLQRASSGAVGTAADLVEARKLVSEVSKARPNWAPPALMLARIDDLENRSDAALVGYLRVLDLGDYRPLALTRALELLGDRGRYADALAVCEAALRNGVGDSRLQRAAAELALQVGRQARARDLAVLAVSEHGENYRDQLWLADVLEAASRPSAARDALERAVELAPDSVDARLAQIRHYARHLGRAEAEQAIESMKEAIGPQRATMAAARAYEVIGHLERAEEGYRTVLKDRPRDAKALSRLAALRLRRDEQAKAEPVLRGLLGPPAVVVDEDAPAIRRQLALALTASDANRIDEALRLLDRNRRSPAESPADARVRALVLAARPTGRAAALKALGALPATRLTAQERLRLARLYDAEGDWGRARELILGLVEEDPANVSPAAALADGLIRHRRRVEAAEWLERVEKLEPGSPRAKALRRRWEQLP